MPYSGICGEPTCVCCTAWDGLYDRDRDLLEKALGETGKDHIIETLAHVVAKRQQDLKRMESALMWIANSTGEGGTDWLYRLSVAAVDPDHAAEMGWPELKQLLDLLDVVQD